MRLLFVVHQFMPEFAGGTEQVTMNLARAAQAAGHAAEVVTVAMDGVAKSRMVDGVPVHAFTRRMGDDLVGLGFEQDEAFAAQFERFLDARAPFDAAHITHLFRTLEAAETLAEWGVPYAVTLTDFFSICHRINLVRLDGTLCPGPEGGEACRQHCWPPNAPEIQATDFGPRFQRLGKVLAAASSVNAVSEYVARRVRAEHPDVPIRVIGNGVDLAAFPPPGPRPEGRPLTFGYLGTISEAKGAPLLARAFARAAPAGAVLRMVGPCYEPEAAQALRAAGITPESAVERRDVPALLTGFDLLCVPSQVPESYSLALHEGFAAGLPALVSDLGNVADVVGRAGCGLVVSPASEEAAWAAAISQAAAAGLPGLEPWRAALPLPLRIEEEAFLYDQIWRGLARLRAA